MSVMNAAFHGGPLDGQNRSVWESRGVPFSFRHVYTRFRDRALHWAYRWERDHYECVYVEPIEDRHDRAMRKQPMFDDLHDYDDGTDDAEEAGTAQAS